jgi:hypothetical protein
LQTGADVKDQLKSEDSRSKADRTQGFPGFCAAWAGRPGSAGHTLRTNGERKAAPGRDKKFTTKKSSHRADKGDVRKLLIARKIW